MVHPRSAGPGGGIERAEQVVGGPEGPPSTNQRSRAPQKKGGRSEKLEERKMTAAARGRRRPAGKPLGSRGGRLTPQRDGPPLEGRLGGRMFTIL